MTLTRLEILPQQASYAVTDGIQAVDQKLDGGLSRYRQDQLDPAAKIKCQWFCKAVQYSYLKAFYKTITKGASLPFLLDLILDDGTELTEHTAYFVPGTFKLTQVRGLTYVVSAELEVRPIVEDEEYNQSFVDSYNAYGEEFPDFYNDFEYFINVYLPSLNAF